MSRFDVEINRYNTHCAKWDEADEIYGKNLIHLAVADMDFMSPEPLIKAMSEVVEHGVFGYTVFNENYFESVIKWMKRQYDWDIKKEWIVFSPRIGIGVSAAISILTNEGDGIIIQEPLYGPLREYVINNNRRLIVNPLKLENNKYRMDFEDLENKIDEDTKMIIICNPQNPVGRVWEKQELEEMEKICEKHDLIVLSDEIHADIIYGDKKHLPMAKVSQAMKDRCIVFSSITKTFNLPGLIIANMIIPNPKIREKLKKEIYRMGMHNPNIFSVPVAEKAYNDCDDWLEEVLNYINKNYEFVKKFINEKIPEFKLIESEGTYLMWIDCNEFMSNEVDLKNFFIKEAKVGIYVGSDFGESGIGYIRMNIATNRARLEEALERIYCAYLKRNNKISSTMGVKK